MSNNTATNQINDALSELDKELGIDSVTEIDELDDILQDINSTTNVVNHAESNTTTNVVTDFSSAEVDDVSPTSKIHSSAPIVEEHKETVKAPVTPVVSKTTLISSPTDDLSFETLVAKIGGVKAIQSHLVLTDDDESRDIAELEGEFEAKFNCLAKKVRDKVINFLAHLNGSASLSCYTEIALRELFKKEQIINTHIIDKMLERPYTIGTSKSQTGQMMQMLPMLKIAYRAGNTLTLNKESKIVQFLKPNFS